MSGLEIFFLVCFLVGVTLSVLSFIGGTWHLPHFHMHIPHLPLPQGHVAMPNGAAGAGHAPVAHGSADMPFLNFATLTAFLAWFGGTGYLLMPLFDARRQPRPRNFDHRWVVWGRDRVLIYREASVEA